MGVVKSLKDKLRAPKGPFTRFLRACVLGVYSFSIRPIGPLKWFYLALYYVGKTAAEVWRRLIAGILWKPIFIARCRKVGRRLQLEQLPYITGDGIIEIGDDVRISGKIGITFNDRAEERPRLIIGDKTFLASGVSFSVASRVVVGSHCLLAASVSVRDNDGHPVDPQTRKEGAAIAPQDAKPVAIGDNVWVGNGSQILKGVTLGDNAVVGARSMVLKDVPPNSVAAGSPAKVIRTVGEERPPDEAPA